MSKTIFWKCGLAVFFAIVFGLSGVAQASNCSNCDDCGDIRINAGEDVEVNVDGTARLDATINGSYDRFSWSCTGGTLSNYSVLDPTFRADSNDNRGSQTCTITVYNGCAAESDSVRIDTSRNRDRSTKFRVALLAKPATTCAPTRRVGLEATIYDQPSQWREFTYNFDCNSDGTWDRSITTGDTKVTVGDLCDYPAVGQYTARVEVIHGTSRVTDTDIIKVEDCELRERQSFLGASVNITKTVRNVTSGGGFMGTVNANPGDTLEYRIVISGNSGRTNNVVVRDEIPAGMTLIGDPELDGVRIFGGDLARGVNIGEMRAGFAKTLTYATKLASSYNFSAAQTTLSNTATVTADGRSANSSAAVQVLTANAYPAITSMSSPVKSATMISTGFDAGLAVRLGIFALGILAAAGCAWYFGRKRPVTPETLAAKVSF
ncbi:MAG: DUF11 domain-containing protein [Candidatus Pacebacteria bacterium]|jgi:uncharacterized repeat protein (TIGR01451 family)|nr:DUF11 domain-containing protein [Candidatus Paceibacterota bacterium]